MARVRRRRGIAQLDRRGCGGQGGRVGVGVAWRALPSCAGCVAWGACRRGACVGAVSLRGRSPRENPQIFQRHRAERGNFFLLLKKIILLKLEITKNNW